MGRSDMIESDGGITVLARYKPNGERYLFVYSDENKRAVRQRLGQMAMDADLSFTWVDAAMVSAKMRGPRTYRKEEA